MFAFSTNVQKNVALFPQWTGIYLYTIFRGKIIRLSLPPFTNASLLHRKKEKLSKMLIACDLSLINNFDN